jgi:dTDP-glucose 4,6-dehydratase
MKHLLITGGAGCIGASFTRYVLDRYPNIRVVVYDILNYRGNHNNLLEVVADPRYTFVCYQRHRQSALTPLR